MASSSSNAPLSSVPLYVRQVDDGLVLSIRVQPNASRQGPIGEHGKELRWAVRAKPESGKANQALVESIAEFFGVAVRKVEVISGSLNRSKAVIVRGLSIDELKVYRFQKLS